MRRDVFVLFIIYFRNLNSSKGLLPGRIISHEHELYSLLTTLKLTADRGHNYYYYYEYMAAAIPEDGAEFDDYGGKYIGVPRNLIAVCYQV